MCELAFGVPSLDRLINPDDGIFTTGSEPGIVCLMGPDGVGKSILSLHLASYFWTKLPTRPKSNPVAIFYFSTDLKHSQARRTWQHFGLHRPHDRATTLSAKGLWQDGTPPANLRQHNVDLQWVSPITCQELQQSTTSSRANDRLAEHPLDELLNAANWKKAIQFIDLATHSAGDDWHLINRLTGFLAGLRPPESNPEDLAKREPHLIIVDAVEGLEALVGEHDAFGHSRNRRSRIAQLGRLAKRAHAHLVFIIEECRTDLRLPEEFVADLVIRLRSVKEGDYDRRTIEIEKARGVAHVRGQHDVSIRQRKSPPKTLDDPFPPENCDDPYVILEAQGKEAAFDLAYVQVFQSLHARNRKLTAEAKKHGVPEIKPVPPPAAIQSSSANGSSQSSGTGKGSGESRTVEMFTPRLRYLNMLLAPGNERVTSESKGLRNSDLTVLLGDSGTHKGRLARNFLARSFLQRESDPNHYKLDREGFAVLFTLRQLTATDVAAALIRHFPEEVAGDLNADDRKGISSRILVRYIDPHFLTSSGLLHMLDLHFARAQDLAPGRRIRFVLDDWNGLLAAHPNLAQDPLLLQTLQESLEDRGLASLLISTQPGLPSSTPDMRLRHDLRTIDARQIFTWPVQFFGTRRTAITTYPAASPNHPPLVYELVSERQVSGSLDNERLEIDRHFSLYSGLENGTPQRIPLDVRLYAGYHAHPESPSADNSYITEVRSLYGDLYATSDDHNHVVKFEHIENYTNLKDYVQFQDNRQLDRTLVFQVDEFWSDEDNRLLLDLNKDYWNEVTSVESYEDGDEFLVNWETHVPDNADPDPSESFQPLPPFKKEDLLGPEWKSKDGKRTRRRTRSSFFPNHTGTEHAPRTQIPHHWDFGMILARRDLWWQARDLEIKPDEGGSDGQQWKVGDVWNRMCMKMARFDGNFTNEGPEPVSWSMFFKACQRVRGNLDIPAFDVDLRTYETFSSLVLEIWFSEMTFIQEGRDARTRIAPGSLFMKDNNSLLSLRNCLRYGASQLYQSLDALFDALPPLQVENSQLVQRSANHQSVAVRHWYATANTAIAKNPQYVPLRTPGFFSTRGDWSLCCAASSRSQLLGQRAIDRLGSIQMNILRLHAGLGLPVRDVVHPDQWDKLRTALNYYDCKSNRQEAILLGQLEEIGCPPRKPEENTPQRWWLRRSEIKDYGRQSFYFFRWLTRVYQNREHCFPLAADIRPLINEHLSFLRPKTAQAYLLSEDEKKFRQLAQDRIRNCAENNTNKRVMDKLDLSYKVLETFFEQRDVLVGLLRETKLANI